MAILTRKGLVRMAQSKRADAYLLLKNGRWPTAYYLYGIAVELAVKAVVASQVAAQSIPDRSFLQIFYSHKLLDLVGLAGLRDALNAKMGDAQFKASWEIVQGWTGESRYENVDEGRARALSAAVDDRNSGVFKWLKTHW